MWRIAGTTGAIGFEIVLAIGIGYFGGTYLDRKFGTAPWISYAGLLAGMGAAVKALLRVVRSYKRETEPGDSRKDSKQPK